MVEIVKSATFLQWFDGLRDRRARALIDSRLSRLAVGHFGIAKYLRSGVSELKIDHGPGYRVYFTQRDSIVVLLLCGGDKRTQDRDIERAIEMVAALKKES